MRNTNLYFGLADAATMAFDDHATQTLQLTTGGFNNPLPAGVNFIANGGLKVTVTYNANHTYGTAYTATSGEIDITAACTIHASSGLITVATAAADPVNGFTIDGITAANNDFDVTQLKPYAPAHGIMYSSGKLVGTAVSGGATTALNFVDNAGVLAATDTITITHASGKQKEFIEDLMDVVADDNKVAGMVVVRDDMRDLSLPTTRGTVIASVA
jgi:hypothetical protein